MTLHILETLGLTCLLFQADGDQHKQRSQVSVEGIFENLRSLPTQILLTGGIRVHP